MVTLPVRLLMGGLLRLAPWLVLLWLGAMSLARHRCGRSPRRRWSRRRCGSGWPRRCGSGPTSVTRTYRERRQPAQGRGAGDQSDGRRGAEGRRHRRRRDRRRRALHDRADGERAGGEDARVPDLGAVQGHAAADGDAGPAAGGGGQPGAGRGAGRQPGGAHRCAGTTRRPGELRPRRRSAALPLDADAAGGQRGGAGQHELREAELRPRTGRVAIGCNSSSTTGRSTAW